MSERYKFHDPDALYFVTLTIVNWIPVFENKRIQEMILESLKFCQKEKGLIINCWCLMPNHLHMIISRSKSETLLGEILRDFKKYSSREIAQLINSENSSYLRTFRYKANRIKRNTNFKVWKDGNHPILLDTNFLLDQKVEYIHNNPVKAGLVEAPEMYKLSSAIDYNTGISGLLEIELIH
jgi:REP element-mobilizing transposase RayT